MSTDRVTGFGEDQLSSRAALVPTSLRWVFRDSSKAGCNSMIPARVMHFEGRRGTYLGSQLNPQCDCAARIESVQQWLSFPSFSGFGRDVYPPSTRSNAVPQLSDRWFSLERS